jgi:hypothetical protein
LLDSHSYRGKNITNIHHHGGTGAHTILVGGRILRAFNQKWRTHCDMTLELAKIDFDDASQSRKSKAHFSVQTDGNSTNSPDNTLEFRPGEFVVYPAHGVGQILAIEVQTIAGACLEFFAIYFAKNKMKLQVPTQKAPSVGMRKLSSEISTNFLTKQRFLSLDLSIGCRRGQNWTRPSNRSLAGSIAAGNRRRHSPTPLVISLSLWWVRVSPACAAPLAILLRSS